MPGPALDVSGLVMSYAGRRVVDGLDLVAPRGALTVVLGPNGAGKTTTIETAEGFRRPHAGTVRVLGLDPHADAARLRPRVGVMLQSGGVWPSVRAGQMVAHAARLYARPLPVAGLLDRLGLTPVARTPYRRLSGGEQQRVGLACALVGRPELVFLDEPTTGLDPQARASVWQLLADLRTAGVALVLTTHLLDEAEALADHVVVIAGGRVAGAGTVAELTTSHPGLQFRSRPGLDLAALQRTLPDGLRSSEVQPGQYRLEGPVDPAVVSAVAAWCASQGALPTQLSTSGGTLGDAYFALTAGEPGSEEPR